MGECTFNHLFQFLFENALFGNDEDENEEDTIQRDAR